MTIYHNISIGDHVKAPSEDQPKVLATSLCAPVTEPAASRYKPVRPPGIIAMDHDMTRCCPTFAEYRKQRMEKA